MSALTSVPQLSAFTTEYKPKSQLVSQGLLLAGRPTNISSGTQQRGILVRSLNHGGSFQFGGVYSEPLTTKGTQ